MTQRQPNILFIQTDQLTPNVLPAYGNTTCKTPNLNHLAHTGIVFDNAYCNFPLCAPSRFSMASGLLASKIGAYDNAAELPASIPTYAHYLRVLGYHTTLAGKMHFVGPDQLHGFEKRLTSDIYPGDFGWTADWGATDSNGAPGGRMLTDSRMLDISGICARSVQIDYDEEITHKAVQEIYDHVRSSDNRPFFLQVSYTHPHDPYLCQKRHWDLYDGLEIPAPRIASIKEQDNDPHSLRTLRQQGLNTAKTSAEDIMRSRRAYYGNVSYIDDQVGLLLDAIGQSGQAEDTVIVFSSDHGDMLGERGLWLKKMFFEPAVRVPLIIQAPNRFEPARIGTLCSLLDLLPTFVDLAAIDEWQGPVEPLDGISLIALTRSKTADDNRAVYAELLCEGIPSPKFMIRKGPHKFITGAGDPDLLFDLERDPDELNNVIYHQEYSDIAKQFSSEASTIWDVDALSKDIVNSQKRRMLIQRAHAEGQPPIWDFNAEGEGSSRWFRGDGNYNDWAFDYLPEP